MRLTERYTKISAIVVRLFIAERQIVAEREIVLEHLSRLFRFCVCLKACVALFDPLFDERAARFPCILARLTWHVFLFGCVHRGPGSWATDLVSLPFVRDLTIQGSLPNPSSHISPYSKTSRGSTPVVTFEDLLCNRLFCHRT